MTVRPPLALHAYDDLPAVVVVLDRAGAIVHWNRACGVAVARSLDDRRGRPFAELLASEAEARRMMGALEGVLRDGATIRVACRLASAQGRARQHAWSLAPAGELVLAAGVETSAAEHADADAAAPERRSERARARQRERRLQEVDAERRWLRAVLRTVPAGVVLVVPGGRFTLNRRAEEMLGVPRGGEVSPDVRILRHDGTAITREDLVARLVLTPRDEIVGSEIVVERADGTRVPALACAAPIRDDDGALVGGVAVLQDVGDQMRAQEAIRANERLLDAIFELLPVGVWIADRTGRVVRGNAAAVRMWDGAPAPSEDRARWAEPGAALARALRDGETSLDQVLRVRAADGSDRTILQSAMPLRDARGAPAGAIVVHEDVTAARAVEDALRRAVLARDELLAVVAHDLRSPLSAIVMQLQLLRGAGRADPVFGPALGLMERQSLRMNRLIQDLLEVARVDAGALSLERTRVAVAPVIEEVIEPRRMGPGALPVALDVELAPDLPDVWAGRDRLLRVLDNLVGNALKFTPPGGRVLVQVSAGEGEVVFAVIDDGPGVPDADRERVFDRFWQSARADRRGIGLGLAITKGIVEAHGGRVGVESRPGAGSTFWFTIPTAPRTLRSPSVGATRPAPRP